MDRWMCVNCIYHFFFLYLWLSSAFSFRYMYRTNTCAVTPALNLTKRNEAFELWCNVPLVKDVRLLLSKFCEHFPESS